MKKKGRMAKNERNLYSQSNIDYVVRRIDHFKNQVTKKWQAKGLTALLSPVFPTAAFKREYAH